ncbi:MAG: type transport system ATP-binding protein [Chloroflexota bacterium]|nr:type transport system ATP-binding protein [Chloroflexota bacterium]
MSRVGDGGIAVEVSGLVKWFRREKRGRPWRRRSPDREFRRAIDSVDLCVRDGEMVAIVGLNGSGKSTLLRVLATLTIPDQGSARVFGRDVVTEGHEVRRHVNRVSVEASFFKEMSPWENLSYATRLYGQGGKGVREAAVAALTRLGLPRDTFDRPMKQLSRGQQQKVAIARSLLTRPSLLLMDEPTTGLDPRSKREVQGFVRDLRIESGVTVLLSTHDLDEAERLCDRVIILDRGHILAEGTPAALRAAHGLSGDGSSLEDVFLRLTGKSFDDDSESETDDEVTS